MRSTFPPSTLTAIIVSLGGFIFGFDASVISGAVSFVSVEFSLNEFQQGWVVGAPTLGAVIGSLFAGPSADALGRKRVLIIIAALYVISAGLSAFAPTYETLVAARFIGGLAFASLVLAPMYIAEISPPEMRGKMISINQFNIVVGFSAAYFANYYLLQLSQSELTWVQNWGIDKQVWRWMLGLELLPAIIYLFMLTTIPRSPRWLISKGYFDEAKTVLQKLFPGQSADELLADMRAASEEQLPPLKTRLTTLFSPAMRLIVVVGLVVGIAQQITGVNAVYFYAPSIFEQSGVGQDAAFSQAIWVGVINVVFTIFAMLLIDKLGRKPLLIFGLTGVFISMSVASFGFYQAYYQLTEESVQKVSSTHVQEKVTVLVNVRYESDVAYKKALKQVLSEDEYRASQAELMQAAANMNAQLILFGILGFVASFAISLGPVMWVLLAEIFPNELRGVGIAFTGLINSAVSFTVQLVFPWELANLGASLTFFIYGGFAVVGLVAIQRLLPETKGKDLEQVQLAFRQ